MPALLYEIVSQHKCLLIFNQESTSKQPAEKEDRFTGTVTRKVYFDYWKAGAGIIKILRLIIIFLSVQVSVWIN